MDKREEIVKRMVSAALHIKYENSHADSKEELIKQAVEIKDAVGELYSVSDKQWQNILADIGSYADCLVIKITVMTKQQAWEKARKIFPTDYEKDCAASERAGYDIYRHNTLNPLCRICDLGNRLEVLTGENGENVTNIWIEPEIIKGMGTNMTQAEYEGLAGNEKFWEIPKEQAIIKINEEFGFEASRIRIIEETEIFYKDGYAAKTYQKYTRSPQYCATDYNYIRFDVDAWQYEMINGKLEFYYN